MRLIDADLLLAVVETGRSNIPIPDNEGVLRKYLDWDGVKHLIERVPTIDAVPVVRCRECQEIEPCVAVNDGYSWCNVWGTVVSLDGFCHKGAKMDGGANDESP